MEQSQSHCKQQRHRRLHGSPVGRWEVTDINY